MTRVAPAVAAHAALAPPAQGPPGRESRDDFAPVLRSEGSKPTPDTSEIRARTASAEGTTPRADDPGTSGAEATDRPPADASPPSPGAPDRDRSSGDGGGKGNGVGELVSAAAHRAHEEGTSVSGSVHAALRAARGEGGATPAEAAPVDPPVVDLPVDPLAVDAESEAVVGGSSPPSLELILDSSAEPGAPHPVPDSGETAETAGVPSGGTPPALEPSADAPPVRPQGVPSDPAPAGPTGDADAVAASAEGTDAAAGTTAAAPGQAEAPGTPTQAAVSGTPLSAGAAPEQQATAEPAEPAGPAEPAEPGTAPRRPGHVPEHGQGGMMRRDDPPAVGWNRRQSEVTAAQPSSPGPPEARPAPAGEAAPPAQGAPVTAAQAPSSQPAVDGTGLSKLEAPVRAGSRLAELVDTFRTVVRVAAQEGRTEARITLHPGELGEVRIRLRYEHGGVSADVLADSRQAAQSLQQAVADLRRSLESQGLNVLWLDVRHGGQERPAWLAAQGGATGAGTQSSDLEDELSGREIPVERLDASGSILDVLA